MIYRLYQFSWETEPSHVIRDNGNGTTTSVPFVLANTDYQQYLKWLAEGNEPLPAEEAQ